MLGLTQNGFIFVIGKEMDTELHPESSDFVENPLCVSFYMKQEEIRTSNNSLSDERLESTIEFDVKREFNFYLGHFRKSRRIRYEWNFVYTDSG